MNTQPSLASVEKWESRVDDLIEKIIILQKDAFDANDLYLELDNELQAGIKFLNNSLKGAKSPQDNVKATALPGGMRTIDDLDESVEAMYAARLRLIEYITPALYLEVTATDVMGVRQLTLEFAYIWQQIRFQALNIPAATRKLTHRIATRLVVRMVPGLTEFKHIGTAHLSPLPSGIGQRIPGYILRLPCNIKFFNT